MRCKCRFVLATKKDGGMRCKTAKDYILGIDDMPLTHGIAGFRCICTHALAYLLFRIFSLSNLSDAEE